MLKTIINLYKVLSNQFTNTNDQAFQQGLGGTGLNSQEQDFDRTQGLGGQPYGTGDTGVRSGGTGGLGGDTQNLRGGTGGNFETGLDNSGSGFGNTGFQSTGGDISGYDGRSGVGGGNLGNEGFDSGLAQSTTGGYDNEGQLGGNKGGKPSMGDKVKGTMEQMKGAMTGNQALKEDGKERKQGDFSGNNV